MSADQPSVFWPNPTPPEVFDQRRRRLSGLFPGPLWVCAGVSRPRNFPHNRYPFRADSHFLYLVGRPLEGAVLEIRGGNATLYAEPPDPLGALWTGQQPSLEQLGSELGIEVKPVSELAPAGETATIPPQDPDSAAWMSELLRRDVDPGAGDLVEGADAALADALIQLRLHHDGGAIAQLRQAAEITARAHLAGMRATRAKLREAGVRAAMEAEIVAAGMTTSYNSIVTVHGEVLHNERHDHVLENGDLLLADVGAETPEGWAGDVTRTWPVNGRFSATQRAIYDALLEAQRQAIALVVPGQRYLEVHRAAGKALTSALIDLKIFEGEALELYERGAAALFFPHGVGHLIGLDVHDMEDLGDRAGYAAGRTRSTTRGDRYLRLDRDLEPGMAVTIEPGFYQIPQILNDPAELGDLGKALNRAELARYADVRGIRIEDDVLVTESGCEVLTRSIPKSADDVEAAMRG